MSEFTKICKTYMDINDEFVPVYGYLKDNNLFYTLDTRLYGKRYSSTVPKVKYGRRQIFVVEPKDLCEETAFTDINDTVIFTDDVIRINMFNHFEIGRVVIKNDILVVSIISDKTETPFLADIVNNYECEIIGNAKDKDFWNKINSNSKKEELTFIVFVDVYDSAYNLQFTRKTFDNFYDFDIALNNIITYIKSNETDNNIIDIHLLEIELRTHYDEFIANKENNDSITGTEFKSTYVNVAGVGYTVTVAIFIN